jgi:hypothetical protein
MKRYAYGWITVLFFLVSIVGHWLFGWYAFLQDAAAHAQQPVSAIMRLRWAATPSRTGNRNSFSSCGRWSASLTPVRRLTSLEGK